MGSILKKIESLREAMRDGDISNDALAIAVDYDSVFLYEPRSKLDMFVNKITKGRWSAYAPMDKPRQYVKYFLNSIRAAQNVNVFYVIFAPDNFKHLEVTGMQVLNKHDIPCHGVYVLPGKESLVQWIKENNVMAFYTLDWNLVPYAGRVGKGMSSWKDLAV
jgi:hypothetical protein